MQIPYLSIIIPIKNEQDNIEPLTAQIIEGVAPLKRPFEIIFVDDGSTDHSVEILKSAMATTPEIRIIQLDRNHGQTAALDAGCRNARGRVIATIDGDCQNDPADIPRMVARLEKGTSDMVAGYRAKRRDSIIRKVSSKIANSVRMWVTKDKIRDTGCTLKVFYRHCLDGVQLFEGMHRFMGAVFQMHGFEIDQVPVRHHPRTRGTTKYGISNRLWKSIKDLLAVRWMQGRCLKYKVKNIYPDE